jgi:PQQ-like domain
MDGRRLFASTSKSTIHGVDSATGGTIWDIVGTSIFQSEPRISPDDQRVYFAHSVDGKIFSVGQRDGKVRWSLSCDVFEENCSNPVSAGFALSVSGQYLYYADIFGKIVALKLGNFVEKTHETGFFDSATQGRVSPSERRPGLSKGAIAAFAILSFVISFGAGFYSLLIRRERVRASRKNPETKSLVKQTGCKQSSDDTTGKPPNGPPGLQCRVATKPTIRSHLGSMKEEYHEVNAEDRFPMPLQGSRRVAPFVEDYSFGATVVV